MDALFECTKDPVSLDQGSLATNVHHIMLQCYMCSCFHKRSILLKNMLKLPHVHKMFIPMDSVINRKEEIFVPTGIMGDCCIRVY